MKHVPGVGDEVDPPSRAHDDDEDWACIDTGTPVSQGPPEEPEEDSTDGDGVTPATESEGGTGGLGAGLTNSAGTWPISARSLKSRAHFLFSTYNSAICVQMLRRLLSEIASAPYSAAVRGRSSGSARRNTTVKKAHAAAIFCGGNSRHSAVRYESEMKLMPTCENGCFRSSESTSPARSLLTRSMKASRGFSTHTSKPMA